MRMNQIFKEDMQLDELSLGGIGRGVEKTASGLAKGLGYVSGIPKGLSKAFQRGKARAVMGIGGGLPEQPKPPKLPKQPNQDYEDEIARLSGQSAPAAGFTPRGAETDEVRQAKQELQAVYNQFLRARVDFEQARRKYEELSGNRAPKSAASPKLPSTTAASSQRQEPSMGDLTDFEQAEQGQTTRAETEPSELSRLAGVTPASGASAAPAATPNTTAKTGDAPTGATPASAISAPQTVATPPSAPAPTAPKLPSSLAPKAAVPSKAPTTQAIPKQFQGSVPSVPGTPSASKKPAAPAPATTPPAGTLPGSTAGSFWGKKLNEEDRDIVEFMQRLNALKATM